MSDITTITDDVAKAWPIRFTDAGNLIHCAWRNNKLHSVASTGVLTEERLVKVSALAWVHLRSLAAELHVPSSVYVRDGDDVLFASWPVHSVIKYVAGPDEGLGAVILIPKTEFKPVRSNAQ